MKLIEINKYDLEYYNKVKELGFEQENSIKVFKTEKENVFIEIEERTDKTFLEIINDKLTQCNFQIYVKPYKNYGKKIFFIKIAYKKGIQIDFENDVFKFVYEKYEELEKLLGLETHRITFYDKDFAFINAIQYVIDNINENWSKSPYSLSFYNSKDIDWNYKPEGSIRVSDHWNFISGYEIHCELENTSEKVDKWLACIYKNGKYEIIKDFSKTCIVEE